MIHHGCTKGVVVAPMGFTRGAKELANSVGVELHDAFSLRTWIMRAGDSGNSETTNERQQGTRFVDLTDESSEVVAMDHAGDMERNEVYVGTPGVGETVAFTGRSLGTAHVNNGEMQVEFYVLPDGRYRAHVTYQDVQALYPSDMTEAFADGRPVNYGKWTEAELSADEAYGEMWTKFKAQHPALRNLSGIRESINPNTCKLLLHPGSQLR